MQTETLHITCLGWQWSQKHKKGSWAKIKSILFTPLGTQATPRYPRGARRFRGQEDSELREDSVMVVEGEEEGGVIEKKECGLGEHWQHCHHHHYEPSSPQSRYHVEVIMI